MPCDIPEELADSECLARALLKGQHIKKDLSSLRWQAFRPKAGDDELSVMRASHLSSTECKQRAKEIGTGENYVGFACLLASEVKETGSTPADSRWVYCGHAHIAHGFVIPAGDPPPAHVLERLEARCSALKELARVRLDPDPKANTWEVEPLDD